MAHCFLLPDGIDCRSHGSRNRDRGSGARWQKPVIDLENCNQCGLCEVYCPDSAVVVKDDHYMIDLDYCKGCGICEYECPADAIQMVEEEK